MSVPCPHCGGTGEVPDPDAGEVTAETLRAECQARGIPVAVSDTVTEADAAKLLDRTPKTLSNWRHTHRPIRFVRRNGRVRYALADLADHLNSASEWQN